ncbi:nucleoside triphosphate pyrophosphohydrolase [Salibacterium salarium]|uniref:Nucleoside triphosphate pyrophosphohydrolase n=1 Tax=Salibacterium salarium TaxID=284579 RepID=A0A428MSD9_9BACI|nr:nucleoside triphosphate pyrophosphohydrolase [Salibacterium salarium]RSL29034.1 nucleoside triphosphate pyrophosphohydrolase [Salibacterium salarium]
MENKKSSQRPSITIVGLGAGELSQLPLGIYRELTAAENLYLRTEKHPVVQELEQEGLRFNSFDAMYEQHTQFHVVYEKIIEELLQAASNSMNIHYGVPGHPLTAEYTVQMLLQKEREGYIQVNILGGQSFLDPMFNALKIDPNDGFQLLDATALQAKDVQITQHVIISQVYDAMIASEVKLTLMEKYPDEFEVILVTAAGTASENIQKMPLFEIDGQMKVDNLTALYVPPVTDDELLHHEFSKLREVIAQLRAPDGCPWDKKQTHQSLKRYLLEESYEVIDAIDQEDDDHLQEELGDVLLQVLLHAQIGEEDGFFTIDDVIETLTAKMIRRHPHVFGDTVAQTEEQVNENWDTIKNAEKETTSASLLGDIPASMPALMRAYELQKKAAKVGFDWGDDAPMWKKLQEETSEWLQEVKYGTKETMKKEFGDMLFVMVNLGRFYKLHPEESLHMTNRKFYKRFSYIETTLNKQNRTLEQTTLEEMDELWEEAKTHLKGEITDEN